MRLLTLGSALVGVLFLKLGATENQAEANCPENSLPCDDKLQCFKRNEWCDESSHCQDGSDEAYCKKRSFWNSDPNSCVSTHFLCDDGRCVPLVAKCDGHRDCSDGSDEKCEPEPDDYNDYDTSTVETTTEQATSKKLFDDFEEEDIPIPTSVPDLVPIPVETEGAPIISSTGPVDLHVREADEYPTHAVSKLSTPLLSSTTPMNFYDKRREEEMQSVNQPPSSVNSYHIPSVTAETGYGTGARQTQDARTTTTTSRPLASTTVSSTTPRYTNRHYDLSQAPVTQAYDSRAHLVPSSRTTSQTTRSHDSRQPDQWRASYTHPTRSYVGQTDPRRGSYQHTTQPTRTYDPRRHPYQHQTPPTRPHDSRQHPSSYTTQPIRGHDTARYPYHYNTKPTRPYDSRDPYQSRPTRPHDSRRDPYEYYTPSSVPTPYTYNPYHSRGEISIHTPTPGTRYPPVTHRIYLHDGYYYGYYDERGHFVVVRTNGDGRQPSREPPSVDSRNRPTTRHPYENERYRQEPLYTTPTPIAFTRQLKVPSRFYFSKDFARIYGDQNYSYLRKGKEFILSLRNSTGGWGSETPRALVALSLINNSFVNDTYETNMMHKYYQVFLGTSLLRGDSKTTTLSRLAMAINGLLATCQNPRDFHGTDLTELIRKQVDKTNRERTRAAAPVSPSVYLSLCLADKELTHHEVHDLMTHLNSHSTPDEYSKDMLSLSMAALSCHLQQQQSRDSDYFRSLQTLLTNATSKLLDRMMDDGSFGSVYSTAIAAQALISVNDSRQWRPETTLDYLKQQQLKDGSFGDFLATYWTLPALSGRSLLHLRNTRCTPPKADRVLTPSEILEFTGPKQHIRYSLYIGYPNVNGNSLEIVVPQGISFFDIMRVAEHQNSAFKFLYEEKDKLIHVYSISNVPNDSERGFQWYLYAKGNTDPAQTNLNVRERVTGDIRDFYPRSDQHVIFWYHPSDITS